MIKRFPPRFCVALKLVSLRMCETEPIVAGTFLVSPENREFEGRDRQPNGIMRSAWAMMLLTVVAAVFLLPTATDAQLPIGQPEDVGMRRDRLDLIPALVAEGLERNLMPGCVIAVGRHGRLVYHRAFGFRQLEPEKIAMTTDTVFDLASITKPVATATSVMVLLEQGKIRLRDKVSTYIPEYANSGKQAATVRDLLTHQAGLIPDNALKDYHGGRQSSFQKIYELDAMYPPRTRFVYSDVGFILLDDLIERQSGMNVHQFSQKYIFKPLGMHETGYLPPKELSARAATTEKREGQWILGEVHDPRAYAMGGVAGHAGLFSTAADIAVYAQMLLQKGSYEGKSILSAATVDLMTSENSIVENQKTSIRGLGWDKLSGFSSNRAENMSRQAFGHGGFTGTVLWIDPKQDLFFIFLSNRVHPNGKGAVNRLAGRIATAVVGAIDDESALPSTELGNRVDASSARRSQATDVELRRVRVGIDVLQAGGFQQLADQRVGLITNHTGINGQGKSTVEILDDAPNVRLAALFSPEHGIAGKLDQSEIADSQDSGSGLPVYSLYGASRKPTPKQLDAVDTLVFDIQDIGCRFYTYISTMGLAMQAAAESGKAFVVLDRPNPIGGTIVSGPGLDSGLESFVAFHSMPVRHGMTVGELAIMFKSELGLDTLDLKVVRCEGWDRRQYFDETGLPWINPSPNMRNLNQAILYPGIGLWETTNLSVGRGTDTPFEIIGAPWIDCVELADALNRAKIAGIQFTPRKFVPRTSKFAGQECGGVQISITNRSKFKTIDCGIQLAHTLYHLYPKDWKIEDSMRLLCNQKSLEALKAGGTYEELEAPLRRSSLDFESRRSRFLLY